MTCSSLTIAFEVMRIMCVKDVAERSTLHSYRWNIYMNIYIYMTTNLASVKSKGEIIFKPKVEM